MSPRHKLTVVAKDPLAEISVYDGAFKRVGRSVGRYESEHEDGLYEVRARLGGTIEEKLVSLDRDLSIAFEPVAFASPIPMAASQGADESHVQAAAFALEHPRRLGEGSGLLVMVRSRTGDERDAAQTPASPAAGLSLIAPDGDEYEISHHAPGSQGGKVPVVAVYFEVPPGAYRLRFKKPDGRMRERSLIASRGWRTQCFMVRRRTGGKLAADIEQGAVSIAPLGERFRSDEETLRLGEAAREALATYRKIAGAAAETLMTRKVEDPMLGLYVAYLLLRDEPEAPVLGTVVENLTKLLGQEHPDVQALTLGTEHQGPEPRILEMPMLRASWDRIVERSLTTEDLVPADSPAGRVATRVRPCAPWLLWDPAPACDLDTKAAAVRSYVRETLTARRPAHFLSRTIDMILKLVRSPSLDKEDREELARTLGIPASQLNDMLSKIGR